MKVMLGGFHGNPNIGLYGFCNDHFCILGRDVPQKVAAQIGETLGVRVVQTNIAGTGLVGVFVAGNNNGIIIPATAFESELQTLRQHKIPFTVIDTDLTALGNNILAGEKQGFLSPEYGKKETAAIEKALGIKTRAIAIARMPTIGALCAFNKHGGMIHHEAGEEETRAISALTKNGVMHGSLNFGNPYISSAILANNKGLVIGAASTGVEAADAQQAFGVTDA